jgi:alpha-ketoglutarate-dependent 2,4-dichlorophenoxyacetate dioxygenase
MAGPFENGGEPFFKTIEVKKLHPTFAAEVKGVDFDHVSDGQFDEILAAMAKVRKLLFAYLLAYP